MNSKKGLTNSFIVTIIIVIIVLFIIGIIVYTFFPETYGKGMSLAEQALGMQTQQQRINDTQHSFNNFIESLRRCNNFVMVGCTCPLSVGKLPKDWQMVFEKVDDGTSVRIISDEEADILEPVMIRDTQIGIAVPAKLPNGKLALVCAFRTVLGSNNEHKLVFRGEGDRVKIPYNQVNGFLLSDLKSDDKKYPFIPFSYEERNKFKELGSLYKLDDKKFCLLTSHLYKEPLVLDSRDDYEIYKLPLPPMDYSSFNLGTLSGIVAHDLKTLKHGCSNTYFSRASAYYFVKWPVDLSQNDGLTCEKLSADKETWPMKINTRTELQVRPFSSGEHYIGFCEENCGNYKNYVDTIIPIPFNTDLSSTTSGISAILIRYYNLKEIDERVKQTQNTPIIAISIGKTMPGDYLGVKMSIRKCENNVCETREVSPYIFLPLLQNNFYDPDCSIDRNTLWSWRYKLYEWFPGPHRDHPFFTYR